MKFACKYEFVSHIYTFGVINYLHIHVRKYSNRFFIYEKNTRDIKFRINCIMKQKHEAYKQLQLVLIRLFNTILWFLNWEYAVNVNLKFYLKHYFKSWKLCKGCVRSTKIFRKKCFIALIILWRHFSFWPHMTSFFAKTLWKGQRIGWNQQNMINVDELYTFVLIAAIE